MAKDADITRRIDRVEEIIDHLETDELSHEDGHALYEDGQELLTELKDQLHDGDGDIIEID